MVTATTVPFWHSCAKVPLTHVPLNANEYDTIRSDSLDKLTRRWDDQSLTATYSDADAVYDTTGAYFTWYAEKSMPVLQLNGIWLEDDVRIPVDSSKKFQNNVWMIRANSSITDLLDNWDSESFWRTHRISVYQTDLQRSVPWIRCTGESSIYIRLMVHYFFAETQLASQYDQNVAGQAWLKGKLDAYQTGSSWREFHASKQQNKSGVEVR